MKFLSLILWLGGLCTDANVTNTDASDTNNYAWWTNHDYIGSFGRIPNEPKTLQIFVTFLGTCMQFLGRQSSLDIITNTIPCCKCLFTITNNLDFVIVPFLHVLIQFRENHEEANTVHQRWRAVFLNVMRIFSGHWREKC